MIACSRKLAQDALEKAVQKVGGSDDLSAIYDEAEKTVKLILKPSSQKLESVSQLKNSQVNQ